MILLDTNAVLFLLADHPRGRPLKRHAGELALSPITLLEMAFLAECGKIAFATGDASDVLRNDPRWSVDDPPLEAMILRALDLTWTRDPFDRLLAAHALHRGVRLATSDRTLLENLPARLTLAL